MIPSISTELEYILLILGLFFVAKILQRYRVPGAITSIAIGIGCGVGLGWFQNDPVIGVFSVLGISILFLFAGMELEVEELRRDARMLLGHIAVQTGTIGLIAFVVMQVFTMEIRPALLVALALVTPSTGFILDSLSKLGVNDAERTWIKSRAIGTEIVALVILLFALQSTSFARLGLSIVAIVAMIMILPFIFRLFANFVLPHAPRAEFAFLLVAALVCAAATKKLGVYYLVGAFVVGVTEQRLRRKLPLPATRETIHAVELFASFFIPFYFLKAGTKLQADNFSVSALWIGTGFLLIVLPIRIASVAVYRCLRKRQPLREGIRLGISLLPTLVFTIVIAEILRDRFLASPALVGGLFLYTLVNTIVPTVVLRIPPEEYDTPEAPADAE